MRMVLHEPGSKITLAQDWTLKLLEGGANEEIIRILKDQGATAQGSVSIENPIAAWYPSFEVPAYPLTLPAGTTLLINTIKFSRGMGDRATITFWISPSRTTAEEALHRRSICVLFEDANNIEFARVTE